MCIKDEVSVLVGVVVADVLDHLKLTGSGEGGHAAFHHVVGITVLRPREQVTTTTTTTTTTTAVTTTTTTDSNDDAVLLVVIAKNNDN